MGGGTKVIVIYAELLARMGHVVRVVSRPRRAVPIHRKIKSLALGNGWPSDPPPPRSHFDGTAIDHHILDRWRPMTDDDVPDADIVIATWWETAEWIHAFSPNKGAKVHFVQGHEVFPFLPVERCHAVYRLPMHKIVVSEWLKRIMSTQYADDAVDVVLNGVDQKQFFAAVRGKQSIPTVGLLFSTSTGKGMDKSLAAIGIARRRIPNLRLVSFGTERPSQALSLPAGTEFSFSPPQDQIRNLYAKCDVWITASQSEGFNLPAMEAMACRTPVVATRTGWPADAVKTGRNGVLVDVDDVAGLALGLDWVLSLPDADWRQVSANAHGTATPSSWEESAKKFEAALMHACRRAVRGEIEGKCSCIA